MESTSTGHTDIRSWIELKLTHLSFFTFTVLFQTMNFKSFKLYKIINNSKLGQNLREINFIFFTTSVYRSNTYSLLFCFLHIVLLFSQVLMHIHSWTHLVLSIPSLKYKFEHKWKHFLYQEVFFCLLSIFKRT